MEPAEVLPLKTLDQVLGWTPSPDSKLEAEPLAPRDSSSVGPRLLVCHDMQGGYLEDRFVDGSKSCDGYRFFHWNYVDSFVYFSHHLVTIPPVGWIRAAHRHGVKVLGTLITEWEDGHRVCEQLLSCPGKRAALVDRLAEICKHFAFDGWLVNIENQLQEEMVPAMKELVGSLKGALATSIPHSQVIWYDSVISTGQLKWQNELNQNNRLFFDACDGIFLNYNWKEEHLERSLALAADRAHDVYVGVDVFGRGCLGGGGFNTCQAVEVASRFGLSVALFAPGWVLEVHGWGDFLHNQHKFWNLISRFFVSRQRCQLPIRTSFCQGFGLKTFRKGQCLCEEPWYDLSKQELQPTFGVQEQREDWEEEGCRRECSHCQVSIFTEDAFNGGGCLKISGRLSLAFPCQRFELFDTLVGMEPSLLVTLTWKFLPGKEAALALRLLLRSTAGEESSCLLPCSGQGQWPTEGADSKCLLLPAMTDRQVEEQGLARYLDHSASWITRIFLLKEGCLGDQLTKIGVCVSGELNAKDSKPLSFSLLLGKLQVIPLPSPLKGDKPGGAE